LALEGRQKERAIAQIEVLQTELKNEPDTAVVAQAGRTLRNIIEGAVASLLATAVQPAIWQSIHEMLRASFDSRAVGRQPGNKTALVVHETQRYQNVTSEPRR
jgi:hypothetical protein